jgi:poly-gamma-glutamate synthesis protein (capsule biosynthesis protein)
MLVTGAALVVVIGVLAGAGERRTAFSPPGAVTQPTTPDDATADTPGDGPTGQVVLAFAGDMHFERHLAELLEQPRGALGPIARILAAADVTMVNLESAITSRGTPERKELEVAARRYHFRTSPAALDVLAAAGVDVVSMANNHGADYGLVGVRDSLRASRDGPIPVIGIGRDDTEAFAPHEVTIRGTDIAILAADASMREGASSVWAAGPDNPGVAAARSGRPRALLAAVRAASRTADVVVVYLHWGVELDRCPNRQQRVTAGALAEAGADVVVGTHAHVQQGSGWLGDTYVSYGLGNFVWYHDRRPKTGVLQVQIEDGVVVDGAWVPARIQQDGRPVPLSGARRAAAVAEWERLRGCAGLAAAPQG